MSSIKKGAKKRCCYGLCRSDTRSKSYLDSLYYFINFPKPCLLYRRKLITTTKKQHIKKCPKCAKCDLWVKKCGRCDGRFEKIDHVTKDTYICSLHFEGQSGPTTEHPDPIECVKKTQINKVKLVRSSLADKYKQTDNENCEASGSSQQHLENMEYTDITVGVPIDEELTSANCKMTQTEDMPYVNCDQSVQTDTKKLSSKRTQVKLRQSSAMDKFVESIKNNDKQCKFYTGLKYGEIVILHNFVNPEGKSVVDRDHPKKKLIGHKKLTPIQQLILVLIRLRVGLLVEDLAFRFEISTALVSKTIKEWIQHLYDQFTCNLKPYMFPSRKKIAETLPKTFKSLKNIRVIVDCTEFQCQSPSNFEHKGNLYSSYKARTTYKALIGCTPNGGVCFVSDVFEGSISDREIFIRSNIADYLEPGDLVLADRGFTVHDVVEAKQAYLNIPPFLNGRQRLSPQEEMETKRIAKQRIYIEHVIGRIKQFRILQKVLPLNLRSSLSQILFVCACLVNFQPPIVID